MKEQRLEELFDLYIKRVATDKEESELMLLIADPELTAKKEALIEATYDGMPVEFVMPDIQANNIFRTILSQPKPASRFAWRRWAVAASIIFTLGAGSYFLFFNKPAGQNNIAKTTNSVFHDLQAPEANRAMITLSNGQKVYLDSTTNGKIIQQGGVEIVKLADGKIAYRGTTTELLKNTLSNPKGSKVIDMALSDGSHVWLNAGSSVTFPLAFTGNERKVSITGEAYFEIAHDAARPFFVSKGDVQVQVLGTHFNVNGYDDEADIKVTLLEGSVKITSGNRSGLLKPGQQAQVAPEAGMGSIRIQNEVDLDEVVAWKNGIFNFTNVDLPIIMRQLARWYDVDIIYEGEIPARKFEGKIQRNLNLGQVT
jgi:ferric-dicitrate binding protein FerR (iron transport regulator)